MLLFLRNFPFLKPFPLVWQGFFNGAVRGIFFWGAFYLFLNVMGGQFFFFRGVFVGLGGGRFFNWCEFFFEKKTNLFLSQTKQKKKPFQTV